jgi:uncharacterized protein DUF742
VSLPTDPEHYRVRPFLDSQAAAPNLEPVEDLSPGLRPFVLTAGRVDGVDPDIDLETQVTARGLDARRMAEVPIGGLTREQRAIVDLCADPVSVAEISAKLGLHLGVTKILVGDLRAAGHLDVHATDVDASHDPETILRVINGLRAFT